ncbi:lysine--tRNA ligase [Candidatus Berkelbacteria bacterium]|nr:lysine--tRNA ligase [Candidatus Berkelbacteria bacterium]
MKVFWAAERAERVSKRHAPPYVVSDWKTPSGHIHVGALRGVLLHDAVTRVLREREYETRYIYGFDDFDPFDKVPADFDPAYEQYLGMPMRFVPAPDNKNRPSNGVVTFENNFGRYFADEFEMVYRSLGVESETLYSSREYEQGTFNEAIRLVLEHAQLVGQVYNEVVKHRSADRVGKALLPDYPVNIRCEACGKIASTEIIAWDGEQAVYRCGDTAEAWANGCGHQGKRSPFNGGAKLPWKIEWAAKWFVYKSDIEGAGKDHYTKGGSRDVAGAVFERLFAPQLERDYERVPEDLFYEHIYLDGRKMSTSKGVGVSATTFTAQAPAEILRLLMIRPRPRTGIEFRTDADQLPDLYDEYDRLLQIFHKNRTSSEGAVYKAVRLEPSKEAPKYVVRFRVLANLIQQPAFAIKAYAEDEKNSPLTQSENAELNARVTAAQRWLAQFKGRKLFNFQLTLPKLELSDHQKKFLEDLAQALADTNWVSDQLTEVIRVSANKTSLEVREAFMTLYQVLGGVRSGPRLGAWLEAEKEQKELILARLKQAST